MEDSGGGGGGGEEPDLDPMIEGEDVDQLLMTVLQSAINPDGSVNHEVLAELGNDFPNIDFAELLQQLQVGQPSGAAETNANPVAIPITSPLPPNPQAPEIEVIDLEWDNEVEVTMPPSPMPQNSMTQEAGVTIIKAEGGITVCHDGGGDLRPKHPVPMTTGPPDPQPSTSAPPKPQPLPPPPVKVKTEEAPEVSHPHHHHHHKEKKKDKDRDRDLEREERKRRHKEKELAREKEREKAQAQAQPSTSTSTSSKAIRHADFSKFRKKFKLLDTSVTVIRIESIMPVKKHMRLGRKRLNIVEDVDRKRQTVVNNKEGKIRLVPRPRPAYEFENIKTDRGDHKRHDEKWGKPDAKRSKIQVFSDSSESELEDRKGNKSKAAGKKNEKDHRKSSKPHGEFSATGARILPFEKPRGHHPSKDKEAERIIRRPKMPDPEVKKEKDSRKERSFTTGGNKESEAKLFNVLQMAIDQQKAKMQQKAQQQAQQFKIPKSNQQPTSSLDQGRFGDPRDRDHVSTSTPLHQIRREEKLVFDQGRRFAPNSYGYHRQNPVTEFGDPIDLGVFETERRNAARAIEMRLLNRAEADDFADDDDTPLDMHDDGGSNDDEDEEPVIPLPPVETVTFGPLARNVFEMLQKQAVIPYPTMIPVNLSPHNSHSGGSPQQESLFTTMTIQKCAWWFSQIDKTRVPAILSIPEDPEAEDFPIPPPDANESVSSFGHVSNPGDAQCQINEISSSAQARKGPEADPADLADEFCGRTLLLSEIRISIDDEFKKIFDLKPGSDYERKTLNATCTICRVEISGKRDLGRHVRSEDHRANFKHISLRIMPNNERKEKKRDEEVVDRVSRNPDKGKEKIKNGTGSSKSSSSKKEDSRKKTKDDRREKDKVKVKVKKEEKVDRVSRAGTGTDRRSSRATSRHRKSRSRSPRDSHRYRRRSRSRSRTRSRSPIHQRRRSLPRRRSTSAEKVAKFLERTRRSRSPVERRRSRGGHSRSRSPKVPLRKSRKHPAIFSEKLKLQAAGKWTHALEDSWKKMEADEQKLEREISALRDKLCDKPESHEKYEGEWQAYWKQTYQEVEAAGHNPDTFDYVPGWKVQWAKRAEEMMEELHYDKLGIIRSKYGMDLPSLQRILLDIPTAPVPPPHQEVVLVQVPVKAPSIREIYTPFEDDLMPRAMSVSSGFSAEPAPPGVGNEPAVTIDTVQKTWELLTGQKMSGPVAPAVPKPTRSYRSGTSTIGSGEMDLDMELIEVLRLMCSLEDQLSILAPLIGDYFIRAEAMEVISSRKSYVLLEDKDFVGLLFQCRDKFMGLIRANILTRDVLKRMNRAVYGLTSILDLEPCQRLRPKTGKEAIIPMEVDAAPAQAPPPLPPAAVEAPPNFEIIRRPPRSHVSDLEPLQGTSSAPRPLALSEEGWAILERIRGAMREFPVEKRREVAAIINQSLERKGTPMTDTELVKYMHEILEPALIKLNWGPNLDSVRRPPSPLPMLDGKREPIRGMGTALPAYAEVRCRAVSPPRAGMMHQHYQQVRGVGPMGGAPRQFFNPRGGSMSPRGSRASMSPRGGRASRSPRPHGDRAMSPVRMRGLMSPSLLGPSGGIPPLMLSLSSLRPLITNPAELRPLIPLLGSVSPFTPPGASPPFSPRGLPASSWSPREVTPETPPSYDPSDCQPASSRSTSNNEAENIPPFDRSAGDAENQQPLNAGRKNKDDGAKGEVCRSLDGSSVSSGSIGCGSGVGGGAEGDPHFAVKKASRSTLSTGSGTARAKLKEMNPQGTASGQVRAGGGDLNTECISEAESGEILSSDDASSVASSVQNRRRKFRQKMEAMHLVKAQRRKRTKVDKELEEWWAHRRRHQGSGAESLVGEENKRGKSDGGKRKREDGSRSSSERLDRSNRKKSTRKIHRSSSTSGRRERRRKVPTRKERRRCEETDDEREDGCDAEDAERRRRSRKRKRRSSRSHRDPKHSKSHSRGRKSPKRVAPPLNQNGEKVGGDSPLYGPREPPPPPSRSHRRRVAPPRLSHRRPHDKAGFLTGRGRKDEHPPPIPALDANPPPPVEPEEHSFEVVSSVSSSSSVIIGEDTINISSSSDFE